MLDFFLCFITAATELNILLSVNIAFDISFKKIWRKNKLSAIGISCISVSIPLLPAVFPEIIETTEIFYIYLYLLLLGLIIANAIIVITALKESKELKENNNERPF